MKEDDYDKAFIAVETILTKKAGISRTAMAAQIMTALSPYLSSPKQETVNSNEASSLKYDREGRN